MKQQYKFNGSHLQFIKRQKGLSEKFRNDYELNPSYCRNCNSVIPYAETVMDSCLLLQVKTKGMEREKQLDLEEKMVFIEKK